MEDRVTIYRAANDADANAGINIVVAMLAKGKSSDEVMAAICMAMAVCNVVFSPDEAARDQNHEKSAEFVKGITSDIWTRREELEKNIGSRVSRLLPAAALFAAMTGMGRGRDAKSD